MSLPPVRRSFLSVASALAALVAALFVMDWAIGRWLETPARGARFDPRFGVVEQPHVRVVQSMEGWGSLTTNALGFFDDELRTPRPKLRALLQGDSYAEALQMSHDENFSTVAERACPGVEVVNTAHSGRFLAHYAAYLRGTWDAVQPDVLVIQVNDTDVGELGEPELLSNVWNELAGHPPFWGAAPSHSPVGRLRELLARSALLKLTFVRINLLTRFERERFARKFASKETAALDDRPVKPRAIVVADSLMELIERIAPRPIIVYIPNLDYQSSPPAPFSPPRRAFWLDLARRHGATIVDPTDSLIALYRHDGQFLHGFANTRIGNGHLNARGHAVVGRMLGRALAERMR